MTVHLPKKGSSNVGESIRQLTIGILNPIQQHFASGHGPIEVNVSACEFITPILAIPLSVLHNSIDGAQFGIKFEPNSAISGYCDVIHFPGGLRPESIEGNDYEAALKQYANKSYIPIVNFPAGQLDLASRIRDGILQALHNLLQKQLQLQDGLKSALFYLVDEMVNNVKDHSMTDRGFIFAQYYKTGGYLDLCLADSGVGILEGFRHNGMNYESDAAAIGAAISGTSRKYQDGGRGYGIRTSIRMLVEGMGGNFFLMSGQGFILRTPIRNDLSGLPESLSWKGTLINMRIPFTSNSFDYTAFLE